MMNKTTMSGVSLLSRFPRSGLLSPKNIQIARQLVIQILTGICMITLLCRCSKIPDDLASAGISGKSKAQGLVQQALAVPPGTGSIDDPNIQYFGRWDFSNATQYVSNWGGAYLRVKFTGTTVKIKVGAATHYYAKIDNGPWVSYPNATGTVNLTPSALASGTHTVTVAQGKDYNYFFNFQGFILDTGATTSTPDVSTDIIEYIGDSITAGYAAGTGGQANVSAYGWVCSEALGTEHTQIAYPGITLVSGYTISAGMDTQYFKLQNPSYTSSPNWDFTKYTPRLIVVNLGTNDNNKGVPDSVFKNGYITFLANIRTKFANAEIFVMRTFIGVKAVPTLAAVNARIAAGDNKVHYINTTGWLTSTDYSDGLHPNVSGHIKAANLLRPILDPYINGTPTLADGTYKIINRNSGLAIDAKAQGTANGTAIQQWTYSGQNNQRWTVTSLGGGQYRIVGVQSGKSLDVTGQSTVNGAKVQLYNSTSGNNQKWIITPGVGGYYTIKGVQSNLMMEIGNNSTTAGELVQIWSSTGGNNQQWTFQTP
ncbi:RICIN domain-containing protein [Pedobacter sp. R-06]|uniref:RICIN domain-containing protein n=1 Tax=Pedobacter sp. R-06 TaxID=3404051 RepID=UPI003CF3630E